MGLLRNLFVNFFTLVLWPLAAVWRLCFRPREPQLAWVLLEGPLRYRDPPRRGFGRFLGRNKGIGLERLAKLSGLAAGSETCRGVLIELREVTGSAAQWEELSRVISTLKAGKKKVAVYAEALGGTAYAAVCGADLVCLPPSGDLHLVGVGTELINAGAALKKLGVQPQFARREGHKTAPELFTEAEPSPAQRETVDRLLDRSFAALRDGLGKRGLSPEAAAKAIDAGPYSGRTALAAGLINHAAFRDQMPGHLRALGVPKAAPPPDPEWLPPAAVFEHTARFAPPKLRRLRRRPGAALVPLSGVIASGESRRAPAIGSVIGSETAVAALAAARRDKRSKSALVTIDSRGGSALASEIVWREMVRLSMEKPTLVYVDAIAASGGYLIACGAPRIFCAPLAIVGSIGVFMGHFDVSGLLARLGVHGEFVGRGAHAGLGRMGALNAEEWGAVEKLADDAYDSFMTIVADARHKSAEEVRALAQGKVYTGAEAVELGLVDRVCGYRDAVTEVRRLGELPEDAELRLFGSQRGGGLEALLRRLAVGTLIS